MIVKMLTQVHMLVYILWCWHTLRRVLKFEGLREDGFLSPSRRACEAGFVAFEKNKCIRRDSALFEKMKCIFSIAPEGNLVKSRECFSLRKHSPDAGSEAPDAVYERQVCRQCLAQLG